MDFLIYSSSIQNVQQSNQSIRIQTIRNNQRSNSLNFRNINVIIKELNKTHTRRKSCYCTECGCLGRFQFENMNTRLLFENKQKREIVNTKSALTLTLPKQEIFFQRKRTVKKTDKKTTIIDSNTTGDKIDEQKTQYFNFNIQSRSSILSNIIGKRELQIKQINKINRPQCLIRLEQKMKCLIPITQKHIELSFPVQYCCSRIKTENQSYHHQLQSPINRTTTKSNYKNSPYYYTYRQTLTPKVKFRNEQKKRKSSIHQ
ncbi:unnamed protein product [Paramecium primaurelia]|uniref:Uncharacterized protein n=1 Tax=Paramecium primaurelia TaxID=5886 RepID=A0A8S1Q200_PARPR|nr:unnamed protein product [Paramecium primaurelia]